MPISVAVQETTILPAKDGYVVQIGISDGPLDASDAALRLTLRVKIGRPQGTQTLKAIQRHALEEAWDLVRPLMEKMYEE